jgi:uncharacterized coiled-coil protein SlyX
MRKIFREFRAGWLVCIKIIGITLPAFGTMPVIDWASLAKQGQEITALSDQLTALKSQLELSGQELKSMTGETDFGNWANTAEDLKNREWSPSDWSSALNLEGDGHSARFNQLLAEYESAHPGLTPENIDAYKKGASESLDSMFQEEVTHNQVSQSMASGAYDDVNTDFKNLHELGAQIGSKATDPDLKHAEDLNSRVQLENANLLVQELRMLALLNQQLSQTQATYLEQQQDAAAYLVRDVSS